MYRAGIAEKAARIDKQVVTQAGCRIQGAGCCQQPGSCSVELDWINTLRAVLVDGKFNAGGVRFGSAVAKVGLENSGRSSVLQRRRRSGR
jgi:hypothetical protein